MNLKIKLLQSLVISIIFFADVYCYKLENVVIDSHANENIENLDQKIESAKMFANMFISSYQAVIRENMSEAFIDSFYLCEEQGISVKVLFSTKAESYIYFYPSDRSTMYVEHTELPIQMKLFFGLNSEDSLLLSEPKTLFLVENYTRLPVHFNLKEKVYVTIKNLALGAYQAKVAGLSKHSFVVYRNVIFELKKGYYGIEYSEPYEYMGILGSETNFNFLIEQADSIGKEQADSDIREFFFSSLYYFEKAGYEELMPMFNDIRKKMAMSEKGLIEYPGYEINKDMLILRNEVYKKNLHDDFIEELLYDPFLSPIVGRLFWNYNTYRGFLFQWVLFNIFLIVVVYLIFKIEFLRNLIVAKVSLLIVVTSINGYILTQNPESLSLFYLMIPGVPYLGCILYIFKKMDVSE